VIFNEFHYTIADRYKSTGNCGSEAKYGVKKTGGFGLGGAWKSGFAGSSCGFCSGRASLGQTA
jgi:hypothetical protein